MSHLPEWPLFFLFSICLFPSSSILLNPAELSVLTKCTRLPLKFIKFSRRRVCKHFAVWNFEVRTNADHVFVSFRFVSIDQLSDLLVEVEEVSFHLHKVLSQFYILVIVALLLSLPSVVVSSSSKRHVFIFVPCICSSCSCQGAVFCSGLPHSPATHKKLISTWLMCLEELKLSCRWSSSVTALWRNSRPPMLPLYFALGSILRWRKPLRKEML